jgi:hypothetical protein
MKTHVGQRFGSSREDGSTLLVSVVIAASLGLSLAGYMTYVSFHTSTVNRSQNWNSGMPVVESGVEEAFTHMNYNIFGTYATNVMTRWSTDGWTDQSGTTLHSPTRTIDGNYYNVRVTTERFGPGSPEIVCVGNSLTFGYADAQTAGGGSARVLTTNFLARQVRVRTERIDINNYGLLAEGNIGGNGQFGLDSFNSMTTNSWYGLYDGRYNADEGTIASISGDINMGSQGILYGTNYTSATGTATNGSVGDSAWVEGGNEGTQPGHWMNNLNTELQQVPDPIGTSYGWPAGPVTTAYTNFATGTNLTVVTTDYYPTPPPPDGRVSTNTTGLVTTMEWPADVDPLLITTNYPTYITRTNWPTDIALSLIVTNPASTWYTNTAPSINSPPAYPQPPAINISAYTPWVTYEMFPNGPLDGTYVTGSSSGGPGHGAPNQYDKTRRVNGNWMYNYTYQRYVYYRYQVPQSYTWPTNSYSYPTVTYTYMAPVAETTVYTRQFAYVLDSTPNGYYEMAYLTLSGDQQVLVRGDAVLWVTGQISMSGQSQIIILPGASLTVYAGGNVDLSGQGIINQNNNALDLTFYGLEGCEEFSLGGNANFTGTIYAPNAAFQSNGGGNDNFDIVGAITAASIQMNGHFAVHYDANLRNAGRVGGYVMRGWYEERVGTP